MTRMRIPLSAPDVVDDDIAAVVQVLQTPQLSLGPKLLEFEQAIARYVGANEAIAVNSGTSGLHLCMRGFGIGEGDEVIVPSFTFIAAANAIRMERATPVFVDIEPETMNLDPDQVEAAITSRTRAILVVHTFGRPASMDRLLAIAKRHGLFVIEDACEALGAEYRGRKVGGLGDAGVFAFYPNKQITTGEGGMIVTSNEEFARRARALRNQGRANAGEWLEHAEVGYNYRLSELHCALGLSQLRRVDQILERRAAIAEWYDKELRACDDLLLPATRMEYCKISWFVYVVRLGPRFTRVDRDAILHGLAAEGIGCGRYFAPIHLQPAYADLRLALTPAELPLTEAFGERCLALPFFNRIDQPTVREVCTRLLALLHKT
jgi:perosamine synthetase